MAPTILIVGATGNTGKGVIETLPQLLSDSKTLSDHRILALTRSKSSPAATKIASLPRVELAEKNWTKITEAWLREHEVVRIFIASHNEPSQFAEEGQFHVEALRAGVQYTVRISTTAANVVPDYRAYYPRSHWAVEQMLSQSEFDAMQWTSLQPNIFFTFVLKAAAEFVKKYRETGQQGQLPILLDADAPTGAVDAVDVGVVAAHLLALHDPSKFNHSRLVINGPEDMTGKSIVALVEEAIGEKVNNVSYRDVSMIEKWADASDSNLVRSITHAPVTGWNGQCSSTTTSKEVLALAPPRVTAKQFWAGMGV